MHPVHAQAAAPWFIVDDVEGREIGYRAIVDSDGFTVCDPSPMGEANAHLISAAPDLLAALIGAEHCITRALPHLPPDTLAVYCGEWLATVREAIAKAEA